MLPDQFLERMQKMLSAEEFEAFVASYDIPRSKGLRVNPLKGSVDEFLEKSPFRLEEIPWENYGYTYADQETPGKHPYHQAGVYYIQEPSAMAPAAYLEARPGERVLDLCAAPGGKSTQIAGQLMGQGLLVANEIHQARAKILSENIERLGIANAVVLNESPDRLASAFGSYFHRIMVDAPCSGEGLFRKQEDAYEEWSLDHVTMCGQRQDEILDAAYDMLLPGGRMVYSTCTFAPDENEGSIGRFLHRHEDMQLVEVAKHPGMADGKGNWFADFARHEDGEVAAEEIGRSIRLWPHRIRGEGHFVAVLQKAGDVSEAEDCSVQKTERKKLYKDFTSFIKDTLCEDFLPEEGYLTFGDQLYLLPEDMIPLKGLKVQRAGLHLGTMKKGRFEPSHGFALYLKRQECNRVCDLSAEDPRVLAYLTGQTFPYEGDKGWYLICVDGYSLGWGKLAGGVMKNHYPKGLRIQR